MDSEKIIDEVRRANGHNVYGYAEIAHAIRDLENATKSFECAIRDIDHEVGEHADLQEDEVLAHGKNKIVMLLNETHKCMRALKNRHSELVSNRAVDVYNPDEITEDPAETKVEDLLSEYMKA